MSVLGSFVIPTVLNHYFRRLSCLASFFLLNFFLSTTYPFYFFLDPNDIFYSFLRLTYSFISCSFNGNHSIVVNSINCCHRKSQASCSRQIPKSFACLFEK